jgi:hypothetical protein
LKKLATTAVLVAVALSGCGTVEKNARYKTVNDLGGAVASVTSAKCGDGSGIKSFQDNGWDQDNCGDDISIAVFADSATQRTVLVKNPAKAGKVLLEGSNWIIWTNKDTGDKLHEKLGGEFRAPAEPIAAEVRVKLKADVFPTWVLWVDETATGPGLWCYGSSGGMLKDLGPDSSVYVQSAAGLTYTSKLVSSRGVDGLCQLTYKLDAVAGGDGPYEIQVGGRKAGEFSEAQLRAGLDLQVG